MSRALVELFLPGMPVIQWGPIWRRTLVYHSTAMPVAVMKELPVLLTDPTKEAPISVTAQEGTGIAPSHYHSSHCF